MIAALALAALTAAASVHHPVTTADSQAQALFDSGLLSLYAYDREGAQLAFAAALRDDPHLAMAAWGEALATGSDLNHPLRPETFSAAQAAAQHARSLEGYASPVERAYIDAVALRYAGSWNDHTADEQRYVQAMDALVTLAPADSDAAMLDAEALLEDEGVDRMWNPNGTTRDARSARILALVVGVLQRDPNQVMANHLCIHAYDDAPDRAPALACADRLSRLAIPPPDEHLAHMPAHAYIETGAYADALAASDRAWQLRQAWEAEPGAYPLAYGRHDAGVGYAAAMMLGDEAVAQTWAARAAHGGPATFQLTTLARFGEWQRILALAPQPDQHLAFAMGLAYAHTGDFFDARRQLETVRAVQGSGEYAHMLDAAIDEPEGHLDAAIASLNAAVSVQRANYEDEYLPLFPADEALGALYLRAHRNADAERAFTQTLGRYPRDPRALYGLALAQRALGETAAATRTERAFAQEWPEPPPGLGSF